MTEKLNSYKVIIPYREPTYEVRTGSPSNNPYYSTPFHVNPYYSTPFHVVAQNKEEAIKNALELFVKYASLSNVGWRRVPEHDDIIVELLER
jgi:hypothetical protein